MICYLCCHYAPPHRGPVVRLPARCRHAMKHVGDGLRRAEPCSNKLDHEGECAAFERLADDRLESRVVWARGREE